MTIRKRAAAAVLASLVCLGTLAGCGKTEEAEGMSLSVCVGAAPTTLDPIRATQGREMTVLTHLYENLLKLSVAADGSTTVTNGMAKSYEVEQNNDGTFTYTFHLRRAKWSDGEAVTARDFVYAYRRLANPSSQAPNARLLSPVKGFDEVQSTGDVSLLAVEAKNDSTFVVTLNGACEWFLTDVCTAAATVPLREDVVQELKAASIAKNNEVAENGGIPTATWSSDHTKLVCNGPFVVGESTIDGMVLETNPQYTGRLSGPETITFRYADTAEEAWALYEAEEVDFVSPLPDAVLEQRKAEDEDWSAIPELNTCTLLFNTNSELFSDPLARQAFSLALDRTALSDAAGGANWPAVALVPYGVPDVEAEDFRGHGGDLIDCDPETYPDRCVQAAELLDQAGYGESYRYPRLECLYDADAGLRETAEAMCAMWSAAIDITVTPRAMTAGELAAALAAGEYTLSLTQLRGTVNDAESFLAPFQSGDSRNMVGYVNSAFDTLLAVIGKANDDTARRGCLHDAEVLLLGDCPLTPLYFTGTSCQLRPGLLGLCRDARDFYSFAGVVEQAS
ncbi:peptide ABC transporter substrate-binding protein [Dysosmobacter sp.]|uniref:peptide ABC transporter substrate-binding protein n=1 Tax=Dysosmobacter sp. TaxID=2591382 RepID=UPI002A8A501A|nr:peptide ABC transporter substrate-binding protein [Dysosmobacter sp.]MDY3281475.1 peptide ABC transporter substrate-binding protein [Dysosmobacter sp.]